MIGRLLKNIRAGNKRLTWFQNEAVKAPVAIAVTSESFAHGAEIPIRYTPYGENLSPALAWKNAPAATRSILLVIEDPDAPLLNPFVHSIVYNLPPGSALAEGAISCLNATAASSPPDDFRLGRCTFGSATYRGPGPIPDHGPHHYYFQIFALDLSLTFPSPPRRKEVLAAIGGHVLAKGLLVGTYERFSRR
jgi:hypothetical protein